jgi:hypothetical protein
MSDVTGDATLALAGRGDAIRIVPVASVDELGVVGAQVPAGPPPKLTYRGGHLLTAVEVFTIFWGAAWSSAPNAALVGQLNQFFDVILTSSLIDQLGEYSTSTASIGHGTRVGTATISTPTVQTHVSDGAIQHFLQQQISAKTVPAPTANRLYFVYLPPGVSVTQGGSRSCQAFCGYHSDINGVVFYAVMPYPGCSGCTGTLTVLTALTSTSSHELCESITDAVPGTGWYDDHNGEIGDICAWKTKTVAGYTVQQEWSNTANACT